jgi:hypothetical protein
MLPSRSARRGGPCGRRPLHALTRPEGSRRSARRAPACPMPRGSATPGGASRHCTTCEAHAFVCCDRRPSQAPRQRAAGGVGRRERGLPPGRGSCASGPPGLAQRLKNGATSQRRSCRNAAIVVYHVGPLRQRWSGPPLTCTLEGSARAAVGVISMLRVGYLSACALKGLASALWRPVLAAGQCRVAESQRRPWDIIFPGSNRPIAQRSGLFSVLRAPAARSATQSRTS